VDLKETRLLASDQEAHWYYAAKSAALLSCLDGLTARRLLDVGAGSGFFAKAVLRSSAVECATCIDPGYPEDRTEHFSGKSLQFRQRGSAENADLVLMMDVLEHVDDDVGLLKEYVAPAPTGARFVVTAPACTWLWSAHDEFLEHRRRYTLDQLLSVVRAAGLSPVEGFYFFGLVFPAAAVRRLWLRLVRCQSAASDLRVHHGWLNALLRTLSMAEIRVARRNRAFGLTAFVVALKDGGKEGVV
jgi:hypothetical protein